MRTVKLKAKSARYGMGSPALGFRMKNQPICLTLFLLMLSDLLNKNKRDVD